MAEEEIKKLKNKKKRKLENQAFLERVQVDNATIQNIIKVGKSYKEQEGDPQVKSKQKQKMREASMRRMMQELPTADVVITNPTHYAVAIRYRRDEDDAPIVIAKGADYLAQKIKEVAKENDIYITEDKPLARMLYANVEIGQMIPPELYEAVANVLAFVYQLQGKI